MPMASPAADLPARRSVSRSLMQRHWSAVPLWVVVLAFIITACTAGHADHVADEATPGTSGAVRSDVAPSPTTSAPARSGLVPQVGQVPIGFDVVGLRIASGTAAGLREVKMCVWEAATPQQRSRGLMWVTDLGGRDGMVFVYDEDRSTSFTMRNTLLDLSIAFFDAGGAFMDAFDMQPCVGEPCPNYPTPEHFRIALEVPVGDLGYWGIGPGARATLQAGCDTP
jgi:uncharacterized membrane protein (UPF0127 family)